MAIKKRKYSSYEKYLDHQSRKLNIGLSHKIKKFMPIYFNNEVLSFTKRFEVFKKYLNEDNILCLGARLGAEVKALRDMGFKNSIGIDLNPGPNNQYVIKGDFHKMDFQDDKFNIIYSNSIDHSWDIKLLSREIHRVLKKNGYLILEVDHLFKDKKKKNNLIKGSSKYESLIFDDFNDVVNNFEKFKFIDKFKSANKSFLVIIFQK
jgi:SAM-dependent methyltransferase